MKTDPQEKSQSQLQTIFSPIYEVHANILQAAFTRLVAWEKAALNAAAARTEYQQAVAGAHKHQQRKRRDLPLAAYNRLKHSRQNSTGTAETQPQADNEHDNNNGNLSSSSSKSSFFSGPRIWADFHTVSHKN